MEKKKGRRGSDLIVEMIEEATRLMDPNTPPGERARNFDLGAYLQREFDAVRGPADSEGEGKDRDRDGESAGTKRG